jgi:hypothetical protein
MQREAKLKYLVAALLFVFPSFVHAAYFDTGDDVWNLCTDNAPGHNYLCIGMSTAYFDMMLAAGYRCDATVHDRTQLRDTFLKYLSDHPGMRNMPASELAVSSWTAAFQCLRPAPPMAAIASLPSKRSSQPKVKGGPIVLTPTP